MQVDNVADDVRDLCTKLSLQKYKNEINSISDDKDVPWVKERLTLLHTVIKHMSTPKKTETEPDIYEEIENQMFKKSWNRLPEVHKIMKVREFLNKNIKKASQRKQYEQKIREAIINKKLNSKKEVEYNSDIGQIVSIKVLKYNKKNNVFELNL